MKCPRGVEVDDVVFTPSGEASGHDDGDVTDDATGRSDSPISVTAFGRAAPLPAAESEGGEEGGRIIAAGSPEEIASHKDSYTGAFLKHTLM